MGPETQAFLTHCWYVAAWDHELIDGKLLPRTILEKPVLIYRGVNHLKGDIASNSGYPANINIYAVADYDRLQIGFVVFFKQAGLKGRKGTGQIASTCYSVPAGSLTFWTARFDRHKVPHGTPGERFGQKVLSFTHWKGRSSG